MVLKTFFLRVAWHDTVKTMFNFYVKEETLSMNSICNLIVSFFLFKEAL